MFAYKPPVTKEQFFSPGFGERKVIMCTQIIQLLRIKHQSLVGSNKPVASKLRSTHSAHRLASANPLVATCEVLKIKLCYNECVNIVVLKQVIHLANYTFLSIIRCLRFNQTGRLKIFII
jgi:hypothetical protein